MNRSAKIVELMIVLREAEDILGDLLGDAPQESDAVMRSMDFIRHAIELMREAN